MADEQTGGRKIQRLSKGDKNRTARHAAVMNELIDAVNMLTNGSLSPPGIGKIVYSDGNWVIQFNIDKC
jgi:hypothetical protein